MYKESSIFNKLITAKLYCTLQHGNVSANFSKDISDIIGKKLEHFRN